MFEVKVLYEFAAAHFLRGYKGKCENMHGHNYKVEAVFTARELDKIGLAVDFGEVKKALAEITEKLDHRLLDALPFFKKVNPSAENLAKFIFEGLKKRAMKGARSARLSKVSVWENDRSCASYSE
jgi:6-pyruvoyltetrahydropterin/6-carboxytetrahydropterin synthase